MLIINVVEGEALPHAQVLVEIHVFLPLLFGHLCTEVLHDCAALAVGAYSHDRPKLAAMHPLPREWRSYSDAHFEVLVS